MQKLTTQPLDDFFVGRQNYIELFTEFIQASHHRVLFIHGPGGIGKTWLLRRFIEEAHNLDGNLLVPHSFIDMYSTDVHSIAGTRMRIIELLEEAGRSVYFENFRQKQRELAVGIREGFSSSALERLRNSIEQSFFADCKSIGAMTRPILFLDTFEQVQNDIVGQWVMRDVVHALPDFLFVVMSRKPWQGNGFVQVSALNGFQKDEAYRYFRVRGLSEHSAAALEPLWDKAKGSPLMIELALEWLSGDLLREPEVLKELSTEAFEEAMVRPLREMAQLFGMPELDEVVYMVLLHMAYMNRRFNVAYLDRLMEKGLIDLYGRTSTEIIQLLSDSFRFVKTRPDGDVQLHDEMERLVLKYLWPVYDPSGIFYRELAQTVIEWYDECIDNLADIQTDDLRAERIFYVLRRNLRQGLKEFNQLFDAVLEKRRYSLAEAAASEIKKYQDDLAKRCSSREHYELYDRLEKLSYQLYQYQAMEEYAKSRLALAEQAGNLEWQFQALRVLHTAVWRTDIQRALGYLNKALELCQQNESLSAYLPQLTYLLGFTYRNMQDLKSAAHWFEACQEVSEAQQNAHFMASALNDHGYIIAMMGAHEDAKRNIRQALKLRLYTYMDRPHVSVGLSYNTLGEVTRYAGDLAGAEAYYKQAVSIFEEIQNYEMMAIGLHALGDTQRRIALAAARRDDEKTSADYRRLAREHFEASGELYVRYGLIRGKETFYRRFGRLHLDEGDLDTAFKMFDEALDAAQKTGENLEILEALFELAMIAALKKDKVSVENYQEQMAAYEGKVYQWDVFPLLMKIVDAELFYALGEIENALELYLAGLSGLAKTQGYGTALFHTHAYRLLDKWETLSDIDQVQQWCQRIAEVWEAEGLMESYPDLVKSCRLHLRTINFFKKEG